VTVIDIDDTSSLLRAKREALLEQLDAVGRALAALTAAGIIDANAQELQTAKPAEEEEATSPVVPTRVKPRRTCGAALQAAVAVVQAVPTTVGGVRDNARGISSDDTGSVRVDVR
jgi:hypothetical protein